MKIEFFLALLTHESLDGPLPKFYLACPQTNVVELPNVRGFPYLFVCLNGHGRYHPMVPDASEEGRLRSRCDVTGARELWSLCDQPCCR